MGQSSLWPKIYGRKKKFALRREKGVSLESMLHWLLRGEGGCRSEEGGRGRRERGGRVRIKGGKRNVHKGAETPEMKAANERRVQRVENKDFLSFLDVFSRL